jgi:LysM repeat protein
MQGIYQIKNLVNNKCYVGQSISFQDRFKVHRYDAKNKNKETYNYPLYRAIRKYGIKNFEFTTLEIVNDENKLTEREIYWYNELKPEYNQVEPTQTNTLRNKPLYMIDTKTLQIVKEFKGFRDAQRYFGKASSTISNASNRKRKQARGYYWCFVDDYSEDWQPPSKEEVAKNKIG